MNDEHDKTCGCPDDCLLTVEDIVAEVQQLVNEMICEVQERFVIEAKRGEMRGAWDAPHGAR
eukprot:2088419-Lingulodinium_polyedra.AAC.1